MSRQIHYYKVTGKELKEMLVDFYDRKREAMNAAGRFSRRVGGHRDKIGVATSFGRVSLAIMFKREPDTDIWKKADTDGFWVPKRARKAKKIREEFDALQAAIPHSGAVARAIGFNGFGGGGFGFYEVPVVKYGDTWVFSLPDYYKPCKGLRMISDITFEKLEGKNG